MSESVASSFLSGAMQRRSFFRVAGAAAAGSALLLAGCKDDPVVPDELVLQLPSGNPGLLSYLQILEQLQATFYKKVISSFPSDMSTAEKDAFQQLYEHEVLHREYLAQILTAANNAPATNLEFSLSAFTLTTRAGVLQAAKQLKDLGVGAYNGAAKLFTDSFYLQLLSRISSVEARHAAFVRDLLEPGTFASADVVASTGLLAGLDISLTPAEVLVQLNKFSVLRITGDDLPTA